MNFRFFKLLDSKSKFWLFFKVLSFYKIVESSAWRWKKVSKNNLSGNNLWLFHFLLSLFYWIIMLMNNLISFQSLASREFNVFNAFR